MTSSRAFTAVALLVAAVGVVVQVFGGTAYPVVPPGVLVLVAAAAVVWFLPLRGAPVAGILGAGFVVFGLFAADQATRLVEVESVLDTVGLGIQIFAVVVALVTAVIALVWPRRAASGV